MLEKIFPNANHKKRDEKLFEYDQIDEHIFIGTDMCCQVHFQKELLELGVTVDISLQEERLDAPYGVDCFVWLPTVDHTAPTQKQLSLGVHAIDAAIREQQKIYVHCKNDHGRAPTLVAAYYISKGMSVDEAIQKIYNKRKSIHLDQVQLDALALFSKQ